MFEYPFQPRPGPNDSLPFGKGIVNRCKPVLDERIGRKTQIRCQMEKQEKFRVPASEIESRILRIQEELRKLEIDGLLVIQRVDLFYFSGTAQNGFLFIPANGKPLLFIKKYMPRARDCFTLSYGRVLRPKNGIPIALGFKGLKCYEI